MALMIGLMSVALGYGGHPAQAAELNLRVRLVWGTDEEKPKDTNCKELDPATKKKLGGVFKWKNYFEITEQKVLLSGKESKRPKLSQKCELEITHLDDATIEIKLIGEGKLTKTLRPSVKALQQGEMAVLAGDDKDKFGDAWFVIITAPKP